VSIGRTPIAKRHMDVLERLFSGMLGRNAWVECLGGMLGWNAWVECLGRMLTLLKRKNANPCYKVALLFSSFGFSSVSYLVWCNLINTHRAANFITHDNQSFTCCAVFTRDKQDTFRSKVTNHIIDSAAFS